MEEKSEYSEGLDEGSDKEWYNWLLYQDVLQLMSLFYTLSFPSPNLKNICSFENSVKNLGILLDNSKSSVNMNTLILKEDLLTDLKCYLI